MEREEKPETQPVLRHRVELIAGRAVEVDGVRLTVENVGTINDHGCARLIVESAGEPTEIGADHTASYRPTITRLEE